MNFQRAKLHRSVFIKIPNEMICQFWHLLSIISDKTRLIDDSYQAYLLSAHYKLNFLSHTTQTQTESCKLFSSDFSFQRKKIVCTSFRHFIFLMDFTNSLSKWNNNSPFGLLKAILIRQHIKPGKAFNIFKRQPSVDFFLLWKFCE